RRQSECQPAEAVLARYTETLQRIFVLAVNRQSMPPSPGGDGFARACAFVDRTEDCLFVLAREIHHPCSVGGCLLPLQQSAAGKCRGAPLRRPSPVVDDAKLAGLPLGK